jgi:hypothetical protein
MHLAKRATLFSVLVVAVAVATAIAVLNKNPVKIDDSSVSTKTTEPLASAANSVSQDAVISSTVSKSELQPTVPTNQNNQATDHPQADMEVRKKWLLSRGHTYFMENDEYDNYGKDTLQKLSDAGDIRAMDKLAKLLEKNGDREQAKKIYAKAAVFGSTAALSSLSRRFATDSLAADVKSNDLAAAKSFAIEAMAYLKAASLRGDNIDYFTDMMSPQTTNPRNLALDQMDYEKVKVRAQQIYDEMQKKRYELGLGEFDNSVPQEEVKMLDDKSITFRY